MIEIRDYKTIKEDEKKYLSFPDIIQSRKNKNKYFLTYRSGESHHPQNSKLHILVSNDMCKTWEEMHSFYLSLEKHKAVWNCPRFFYLPDNSLNIVCDTKSSLVEKMAEFKDYILKSYNDGESFTIEDSGMRGMVPDAVISFRKKLYCANHVHDNKYKTLTQLVNYSQDEGKTWYNCSILARGSNNYFCEASLVNYKEKFLIAYLRDNKRGPQPIYKYITYDGYSWKPFGKLPVYGHRPTAIIDRDKVLISYRDTKNITLSVLTARLDKNGKEKDIEVIDVDQEKLDNKFHFGYTGLVKCQKDLYYLAYYIQKDKKNPFIKGCFLEYKN
jgi:hypothetical protein